MTIGEFDHLDETSKRKILYACCGCESWIKKMLASLPAEDLIDLFEFVEENWEGCSLQDWIEAFNHSPLLVLSGRKGATEPIYINREALEPETGQEEDPEIFQQTIEALAESSLQYKIKFGFPLLISSKANTAGELLGLITIRLRNDPPEEMMIASDEQKNLIRARLETVFGVLSEND
jgi:2-oxo-4-hydroxy-4-carboxy-5-ureidoimidazoline decarboxylase